MVTVLDFFLVWMSGAAMQFGAHVKLVKHYRRKELSDHCNLQLGVPIT